MDEDAYAFIRSDSRLNRRGINVMVRSALYLDHQKYHLRSMQKSIKPNLEAREPNPWRVIGKFLKRYSVIATVSTKYNDCATAYLITFSAMLNEGLIHHKENFEAQASGPNFYKASL